MPDGCRFLYLHSVTIHLLNNWTDFPEQQVFHNFKCCSSLISGLNMVLSPCYVLLQNFAVLEGYPLPCSGTLARRSKSIYRCLYKGGSHPPLMFVGVLCCSCLTLVSFHLWTCLFPITSVGYGEGDRFHLAPFCVKFLNKNTLRIYNPLSFSLSKLKKPHWSILRAWWRPKGRNHSSLTYPYIAPSRQVNTQWTQYVRRTIRPT